MDIFSFTYRIQDVVCLLTCLQMICFFFFLCRIIMLEKVKPEVRVWSFSSICFGSFQKLNLKAVLVVYEI